MGATQVGRWTINSSLANPKFPLGRRPTNAREISDRLVPDVKKQVVASEVPASVLQKPNVPRLFDAACFQIVV